MITIKEVKTRRDRLEFVQFPNRLYAEVPQYVPGMVSDDMANINPTKNPAFEYCEMRFFLAEKDGKTVGRIGAIISHKANQMWGENQIRITRFDFIEDYEVFTALIKVVEDWGKERGLTEAIGPIGFCDMDKEGMLVEGFDRPSMFITYYNHPYYVEFMERYGYEKEVDWTEHIITLECPQAEKMDRISQRILQRGGYRVLEFKNKKQLKPWIPKIFEMLNNEYKDLYGMVPLTPAQTDYYVGQFLTLLNLRYISLVADKEDNLVALGILAPSLAEPMRKCKGKLFPIGWYHTLKAIARPKILDMYFVAVKTSLRKSGLNAVVMNEIYKNAKEDGILYAETGPELELNHNVQTMWEYFEAEMNVRRRRCWKKALEK